MAATRFISQKKHVTDYEVREFLASIGIDTSKVPITCTISDGKIIELEIGVSLSSEQKEATENRFSEIANERETRG
jgi:hypothetical protein